MICPDQRALLSELDTRVRRGERAALQSQVEWLCGRGLPEDVAERVARIVYGFRLLDIVETAQTSGHDVNEVARVYFVLSEQFRADTRSRVGPLMRHPGGPMRVATGGATAVCADPARCPLNRGWRLARKSNMAADRADLPVGAGQSWRSGERWR